MKKYGKVLFSCAILLSFTIICYLVRLQQSKIDSLNMFLYELSKWNQIKSIIAGFMIFGLGLGTLINMNAFQNDIKMLFLLSIPTGIAFWGILSILVMLSGIKYSLVTMILSCVVVEVLTLIIRSRKKIKLRYKREDILKIVILTFGIISVLSIGLVYAYSAGDTITYIDLLGKAFVIEGGFSSHFETVFLSTGIGLATLSSLTYMLGSNNVYIIHSMFILNFFFFLWYVLYKKIVISIYTKYARVLSFICAASIFILPPILYFSGWIISNVYIMCYLFILSILLMEGEESSKVDVGTSILTGILCVFFVYLRSDALITLSCLVLSAVIGKIATRKMILFIMLPSLLAMILYYGKIYLILGTKGEGLFLDVRTIGAMFILMIMLMVYYAFFRNKRLLFFQKNMVLIVTIILLLFMAVLYMVSPETFIYSMSIYNINTTDISSQGGFWGVTGIFVLMMLLLSHMYNDSKFKSIEFLVIILVLTNMIMGPLRAYLGVEPRIGVGDSFNRAFISYLPLVMWVVYDRLFIET